MSDVGEYLTTGLFVSGCYFSVIFSNKLLNFVLFHKCSFSLIVLSRGSVSYATQCTGKMSEFQNSKFDSRFSHGPLPIIDSYKQVMKILHPFAHSMFFLSKMIC